MATTDNSAIQPLDVYDPICSSDSVWYKDNELYSVSDKLDDMDAVIAAKADSTHTHTDYASQSDLALLEDVIGTKANAVHTHSQYASSSHSHDDYASVIALDTLESELDSKADASHTHAEYAPTSHTHSEYAETNHAHSNYAETTHAHDNYASVSHTHTASEVGAAVSEHNHDEDYAVINHTHTDYATVTSLNELSATVSGKANASHSHDDVYYTETEIDTKLAAKADSTHNHDGVYDVSGAAASALTSANAYTDSKIDALVGEGASVTLDTIGEISSAIVDNQDAIDLLNAAIANKANATDLNSHANDTGLHITTTERNNWNAKSDFSGSYNDLTNKPSIPSIDGLASEDYVDEKVGSVTVESIGALPNTTVIPTVPTNVSAFTNDAGYLTEHQSLDGLATETYVNTQIDAIDIPSALSDLTTDSTHRLVTDTEKAVWNAKSDFSGNYNDLTNKPSIPSITGLATETYVDEAVSSKADSGHNHNDVYYTETEVDALLSGKANTSHTHSISNVSGLQSALDAKSATTHNHDASYDAKGSANSALTSAKAYTDELIADEVANRDSAIATAKSSAISTASSDATTKANNALASAKTYTDSAVATVKNDLLNGAGTAYDTLKELGDLIDDNTDAISALETVASGKANSVHAHAISDITNLQTTLDGKANTSHGTHVTYSTTAPVMDGTASAGTASTVARSDHKHPTDTSRAAQTDLDALETVVAGKANSSHTHTIANITNLQTTLDGKAASSHTHGAATTSTAGLMSASDKAKLDGIASGANAYTLPIASSTLGGVKTTSTVTSNSGYTACPIISGVPYYKDTNTTYSLSSFGVTATASELNALDGITATVTELNYVDGVTSNIQTQLNAKASSSHTHSYAGSSSVGGAATSANKLNTNAGDANTPVYFANGIPVACTSLDLNTTGSSASCTGNAATATNVAWSGVTSKPSYYDAKAIKSITRSGTTFTYTCMDGTTGTFTQQDNNTTYGVATTSANGLMSSSDKSKLDGMVLATVSEVETYLGI